MRMLLFLLLLSLTTAGLAQSQPANSAPNQPNPVGQPQPLSSTAIDSLVQRTLRTFDVPGIAVCVIKDGKVIHSKGYGVRSLDTRQPMNEHALFGIASNSKAFAAYGLGFGISDVKGYKQISHTGGLEGMVTQITMIPELQLGIIVLTNQEEAAAFTAITNQIKDGYFGITGTDRVAEYAARRNRQLAEAKKSTDSIWKEVANFHSSSRDLSIYLHEKAIVVDTHNDVLTTPTFSFR